eukprot:3850766-Rhodomonas_salina.6
MSRPSTCAKSLRTRQMPSTACLVLRQDLHGTRATRQRCCSRRQGRLLWPRRGSRYAYLLRPLSMRICYHGLCSRICYSFCLHICYGLCTCICYGMPSTEARRVGQTMPCGGGSPLAHALQVTAHRRLGSAHARAHTR